MNTQETNLKHIRNITTWDQIDATEKTGGTIALKQKLELIHNLATEALDSMNMAKLISL